MLRDQARDDAVISVVYPTRTFDSEGPGGTACAARHDLGGYGSVRSSSLSISRRRVAFMLGNPPCPRTPAGMSAFDLDVVGAGPLPRQGRLALVVSG